jgi:hypothetical protein
VPEGAELPWLYKTAGFMLANHRRKLRALPVAAVPEAPDDVEPETLTLVSDSVRQVLARLTPRPADPAPRRLGRPVRRRARAGTGRLARPADSPPATAGNRKSRPARHT